MNDAKKLTMLKVMVGIPTASTSDDAALNVYLSISAQKIIPRVYPYNPTITTVPVRYETLQCEIAAYLWNKRGGEGETSHSENGISRSYENADVPDSMLRVIVPFCGVFNEVTE